jgi:hypothetical protein
MTQIYMKHGAMQPNPKEISTKYCQASGISHPVTSATAK